MRQLALWLGIVTVLTSAIAAYAVWQRQMAVTPLETGVLLFPDLAPQLGAVAAIEISGGGNKLRVTRNDKGEWVLPDKGNYPVMAESARRTLLGLSEMTVIEPKTDKPELYARIGVADPAAGDKTASSIRVLLAGGSVLAELIVGKTQTAASYNRPGTLFVRKPEDARSWLVQANFRASADLSDWVSGELVKVDASRLQSIEVRHSDGERLLIRRVVKVSNGNPVPDSEMTPDFELADLPAGKKVSTPLELNATASALEFMELKDIAPRASVTVEQSVAVTEYKTKDGLKIVVRTAVAPGDDGGKVWAMVDAESAGGANSQQVPAEKAVAEEAETLNARLGAWAYQVAVPTAQALRPRLGHLLEGEKAPVKSP
jgi:hypothetical protein